VRVKLVKVTRATPVITSSNSAPRTGTSDLSPSDVAKLKRSQHGAQSRKHYLVTVNNKDIGNIDIRFSETGVTGCSSATSCPSWKSIDLRRL